jgi:tetratricopeptide (TPR) repeat protein
MLENLLNENVKLEIHLYQDSIDAFNIVLSINPNRNDVYHHLAVIYNDQEIYNQSLYHYEIYLNKYPNNLNALVSCSCVHLKLKQYDLAIKLLYEALVLSPANDSVLIHLSMAYELKGDKENSVKYMKQILEIRAWDWESLKQFIEEMLNDYV